MVTIKEVFNEANYPLQKVEYRERFIASGRKNNKVFFIQIKKGEYYYASECTIKTDGSGSKPDLEEKWSIKGGELKDLKEATKKHFSKKKR